MNTNKNTQIIDELKTVTLIELTSLVKELEKVFSIDTSIYIPPVTSNLDTSISLDIDKKEPIKEEKTAFAIKLVEVPTQNKIAILKVIRSITGLGLKESKEIIDNIPKIIKEGIEKEECERFKKDLETAGAKIIID